MHKRVLESGFCTASLGVDERPIMPANIYVFEGSWDRPNEAPQVLPFLSAYEQTFKNIKLNHRTIRNQADLAYYIGKIPKGNQSLVYIACHGDIGLLDPSDKKSQIHMHELQAALNSAKQDSIAFLHLGCCHFLQQEEGSRRNYLNELIGSMEGGRWVSGYTKEVDWLGSLLLDLAFISEVYVPWREAPTQKREAEKSAERFLKAYEQLVRSLGFSALSTIGRSDVLIPHRLSS